LTPCVDEAITALTESGELAAITDEWLADFIEAPVITDE
jgi:ABC-type amino acid transport substrate-binding protein